MDESAITSARTSLKMVQGLMNSQKLMSRDPEHIRAPLTKKSGAATDLTSGQISLP